MEKLKTSMDTVLTYINVILITESASASHCFGVFSEVRCVKIILCKFVREHAGIIKYKLSVEVRLCVKR